MSAWRNQNLGTVCEVLDSLRRPITKRDRIAGPYPYYGATGVVDHVADFIFDEKLVLVGEDGAKWESGEATAFIVEGKCWVNNHAHVLRPLRDKVLDEWLAYYLTHLDLSPWVGGMTVPKLNQGNLREIPIPLPPLAEQQRIVAILDEAFEGIARATANAERNLANSRELIDGTCEALISGAAQDGESVALATLLERGWIAGHLDGNHGSDYPRKEEFVRDGVPYISANAIDDDTIDISAAKYLSPTRADRIRKGVAQHGDVLFAHNATVGPVAVLTTDEPRVILGTSLTYYRCNPHFIDNHYLAHYMRSRIFHSQYDQIMRQSTRNQVPITKQREFFHLIPSLEAQRDISRQLNALDEAARSLRRVYVEKALRTTELRQSLLYKAFSGKLTAKTAMARRAKATVVATHAPEFTADILAFAYSKHVAVRREKTLGRVKGQKILHLVESVATVDLGREPIKDAAGPNDSTHMRRSEQWAAENEYFTFVQRGNGSGYDFKKGKAFDRLFAGAHARLASHRDAISRLIEIVVPMDSEETEVLATVHSAWNNLLIDGIEPTRQAILLEARQNWTPSKLNIAEAKFENAIRFIRKNNLIPDGSAKPVRAKQESLF